ncbi:MAG: hypothetical protein QM755_24075 [Luteolibacter sp.]
MRAFLLLPCLLVTSCSLFKKDKDKETAAKPGFTIFEAPEKSRTKENMLVQNDGTPAQGGQNTSPTPLPTDLKQGSKPLSGQDTTGYRMPSMLEKMPEDSDFRGSSPKSSANQGVIATPPKQ